MQVKSSVTGNGIGWKCDACGKCDGKVTGFPPGWHAVKDPEGPPDVHNLAEGYYHTCSTRCKAYIEKYLGVQNNNKGKSELQALAETLRRYLRNFDSDF